MMRASVVALLMATTVACGPAQRADETASAGGTPANAGAPLFISDAVAASLVKVNETRTGDFEWTGSRRIIRALVPYSHTFYDVDLTQQTGLAYDGLKEFETTLRAKAPRMSGRPQVVIIPTSRDRLFPALAEGLGEVAIGGFAVTGERAAQVHFSLPTTGNIHDIIVTGPSAPVIGSIDDLSGKAVHVRRSSSAYDDLTTLNKKFAAAGKPPIRIVDVDVQLEDEDVLQMIDAGIFPMTVVKELYATTWAKTFGRIVPRPDLVIRDRGSTVWAVRNDAPVLQRLVDEYIVGHGSNTDFGSGILQKYFTDHGGLKNPISEAEVKRFRQAAQLLQRYGAEYDIDWVMVAAVAFQESQFDQAKRGTTGAIGVLQIPAAVAADPKIGLGDVLTIDNNIRAGMKYLRFIMDQYYADTSIDRLNRGLFAVASYNAGPAKVALLRDKAKTAGLDPNRWFYNVEIIAARELGRDTVEYVGNVYKYFVAYNTIADRDTAAVRR